MTMILNFGVLKIREVKSVYLVVKSRITVVSVIMIAILVKNWFNLEKLFETVNAQMKIMNGKCLCFVCSKITNRILFFKRLQLHPRFKQQMCIGSRFITFDTNMRWHEGLLLYAFRVCVTGTSSKAID